MSYTFPHFDDIPHPELIAFTAYADDIVDIKYCELMKECKDCVFKPSEQTCATTSNTYLPHRKALLAYVKANHPEYLL